MKVAPFVVLLGLATAFAAGQAVQQRESSSASAQPAALVRSLYREATARRSHGVPGDADIKAYSPYLSNALLRRINDAKTCDADWRRQHPDLGLKPPGRDYGLFSGGVLGGLISPSSFKIEKTELQKNGSFRVHVTLKQNWPVGGTEIREAIPVVILEDGHLAVNDVTYPPGVERDPDPPLSAYLTAGCDGDRWVGFGGQRDGVEEPEALVRNLYKQVVARHPIGIPSGIDERFFTPYLSNALLHKFDIAIQCAADWDRKNQPPPVLKPEYAWLELGIFSGGTEHASPKSFQIEKSESQKYGSFRVVLRLTWEDIWEGRQEKETWRVAAVVAQESGHLVVDDVIYLPDQPKDAEFRLSKALTDGCDGPHWIGYDNQGRNLK